MTKGSVLVCYGTRQEIIKHTPVIHELDRGGRFYAACKR